MLNLTSKLQTIVIYALLSLLFGFVSAYLWEKIEVKTLKNEIDFQKMNSKKFEDAEKSCKNTLEKLIENNRKKSKVLQRYKTRAKEVSNEKIDTVDSFINFADRMQ